MARILLLVTFFALSFISISSFAGTENVDHPMGSMEDAFDCLRNAAPDGSCTEPPLTYVARIQQSSIEGRDAVLKMVENGGQMTGDQVNHVFDLLDVLLLELSDSITQNDVDRKLLTIREIIDLMNQAHAPFNVEPLNSNT